MAPNNDQTTINNILVVGGGAAGWLTACLISAVAKTSGRALSVSLVESPNIPLIGVGEGTWPSMRKTLQTIGIDEYEFVSACDASFKQGSSFVNWSGVGEQYYHPFSLPHSYSSLSYGSDFEIGSAFASQVSPQPSVCDEHQAPKQAQMPPYAFALNYGYHLDAVKFARLLTSHGVEKLGVQHLLAEVDEVNVSDNAIESIQLSDGSVLNADLYIDCTGSRSLLIGEALGTPLISVESVLPNNRAIAVQVPYCDNDDDIASVTISTAQKVGWTWDIGLQSRRGVGQVYSASHLTDLEAEAQLRDYVKETAPHVDFETLKLKHLKFTPGYRSEFWKANCVAIGMSAGFIEPLEASALALIEQSAKFIAEKLPKRRENLKVIAKRFNEKFLYHWQGIVDFLSLHYVLSNRADSEYWRMMSSIEHTTESLRDNLMLWSERAPALDDRPMIDELFPMASYLYVLKGMGHVNSFDSPADSAPVRRQLVAEVEAKTRECLHHLPKNRTLLNEIRSSTRSSTFVE